MTNRQKERDSLHNTIWKIANDLRGQVDGWDFKNYVLGTLFYRFLSENLTKYLNIAEHQAGNADFDYATLSDVEALPIKAEIVAEKGFFILPSQLFYNVLKNAEKDNDFNITLGNIFRDIEGSAIGTPSEENFKDLFRDFDTNSPKLGENVSKKNEKLRKLLTEIGDLELGNFTGKNAHEIDVFGDAYEYLIKMYAANAGKSGGEFFTPQEVSELLANIALNGRKSLNKVYDPACGSGSLLLKFSKILGKSKIKSGYYGQEVNLTTYNLCRMNMILHEIGFEHFHIAYGDTLIEPKHWDDQPFDAIVSNPPYSTKWEGDSNPILINDRRFAPAGVLAPKSKADLAFTMHILSWLSTAGTAAIVEFPGVLYRSGTEKKIRQYLIENNYIDSVIQLPPDLFFGTTIATCIITLKKSKTDNQTLFVDASSEFSRSGNKNILLKKHQGKILEALEKRVDIPHFAKLVPNDQILENEVNLSVSSYVEAEDLREKIDIKILNQEIEEIVKKQSKLRSAIDAIVADLEEASA
ncbi:type I restriction-modification system subunit M [Acetobacteraceae bacterium]|nr:type I restriction-modification system subunit M [Acetobacteraceae bacterium]